MCHLEQDLNGMLMLVIPCPNPGCPFSPCGVQCVMPMRQVCSGCAISGGNGTMSIPATWAEVVRYGSTPPEDEGHDDVFYANSSQ